MVYYFNMKNDPEKIDALLNYLWRLAHKYASLEKSPLRYNDNVTLSPGEIHTIQAIGKNKDINVRDLGEYFGISKSAASQMVTRLVRKAYVNKENPADNNKELCLSLTARGWEAFSVHESFHNRCQEELTGRIKRSFSDTETDRFKDFLQLIDEVIKERLKEFPGKK